MPDLASVRKICCGKNCPEPAPVNSHRTTSPVLGDWPNQTVFIILWREVLSSTRFSDLGGQDHRPRMEHHGKLAQGTRLPMWYYLPPPTVKIYQNISWAIYKDLTTLGSTGIDIYGKSESSLGKSFVIRNLINLIAEIHLPLSTISRVSTQNPKGNEWGTLFKISRYSDDSNNNLQYAWKNMFEQGTQEIESPLTQQQYSQITSYALGVVRDFTYEQLSPQMKKN